MAEIGIILNVLICVSASVATAVLTWRFSTPDSRLYLLDHPNERSLHTHPTPRTGGIAIVLVCLVSGALLGFVLMEQSARMMVLGMAMVLLSATSFVDDRRGLTPGRRLLVHAIAAAILLSGGLLLRTISVPGATFVIPLAIAIPVTLLFVVWMVNLYNFMDGMDGFAGGMAVFGFGTYAILGLLSEASLFASLNSIVAAAAAGFLVFNFPPARIFMGDTGSSTLGLLAAAFSLWGAQEGVFPFWVALLVFSPFIVDATVTLFRRLAAKENIWQAHRTHYYQRLVLLGWSHRCTVLWQYLLMAGCAVSAVWAVRAQPGTQWAIIAFWASVYVTLAHMVRAMETKAENG